MDHFAHSVAADAISPRWMHALREAARRVELDFEPVAVRGWMNGVRALEALEHLGAEVEPVEPLAHWILGTRATRRDDMPDGGSRYADGTVGVSDFTGVLHARLDGQRFLVMRTDVDMVYGRYERSLVLGAPSLEVGLRIARRITEADGASRGRALRLFGASAPVADLDEVSEEDLVFPDTFREEVLRYLDSFRRAAPLCRELRMAPSRGVLLVGRPGTGKTLLVRHLMTRFHDIRRLLFISDPTSLGRNDGDSFKALLHELARTSEPALVVVEDVDRLFEQGSVSPQLFLNVLDGVLQPRAPTLWIATSNDPAGLDDHLLDRPGRFDRVFVFPLPERAERERMVDRYAPWPLDPSTAERIAARTEGMSGAHIREICLAAALDSEGDRNAYAACLDREVGRVRRQHEQARRYREGAGRSPVDT